MLFKLILFAGRYRGGYGGGGKFSMLNEFKLMVCIDCRGSLSNQCLFSDQQAMTMDTAVDVAAVADTIGIKNSLLFFSFSPDRTPWLLHSAKFGRNVPQLPQIRMRRKRILAVGGQSSNGSLWDLIFYWVFSFFTMLRSRSVFLL